MKPESFRFPEFGHGGDHIGSRRARRAFQFSVAASVLFTAVLWYAEYFLRYDSSERLYLSALTLETPSARALLRSAVKQDSQRRKYPTPKYLQALAEVETDDQALPRYREAYSLDPENAWLAIRLGCRLLLEGLPADAQKRFQEAGLRAEDNALPLYLEAAVLPWATESDQDLSRSVALISRTNNSERTVTIGRPLWLSGLPQDGYWYADLRRELIRETLYPIEYYVDFLCERAADQVKRGETLYWDTWLEKVQEMGRIIAAGAVSEDPAEPEEPGAAVQALAGIRIQLKAIGERERIRDTEGVAVEDALVQRKRALVVAETHLRDFEGSRAESVAEEVDQYAVPMLLTQEGLAILCSLWIVAFVGQAVQRRGREVWSLQHSRSLVRIEVGTAFVLFVLLAATLAALRNPGTVAGAWGPALHWLWRLALAVMALAAVLAPMRRLPSAADAARRYPEADPSSVYRSARVARRRAFWCMARRGTGIALGLFLCTVAAWVILHRVSLGLYPWQVKLLANGFAAVETQFVRDLLSTTT